MAGFPTATAAGWTQRLQTEGHCCYTTRLAPIQWMLSIRGCRCLGCGVFLGAGNRINEFIERDAMRNHTEHRTTGRRAGRMTWVFLTSAALLAGCAAQPKSTAPPERAAQPASPEAQPAEVARPTGATENEATPPPAKPAERPAVTSAEPSETVPVKMASAGSADEQPVASLAGPPDDQSAARPTIGARAPRSQARASAAAVPEHRQSAQGPPAAKPARKPPVGKPPKDQPNAKPAKSSLDTTVSPDRPARKPPPDRQPLKPAAQQPGEKAKKAAGCGGGKGGTEPTPSATGPQPLWACSEPKCVIEPIWRGQKAEFVFAVSNEGEGDLQIRLKAG